MASETIPAPPPLAAVSRLYDVSLVDIPGCLRRLADDIEAGAHGAARTMAIALHTDYHSHTAIEVFGYGKSADAAQMVCVFQRAGRLMESNVLGVDDG